MKSAKAILLFFLVIFFSACAAAPKPESKPVAAVQPPPLVQPASEVKPVSSQQANDADPYLWLEDIGGEKAMSWVKECNAQSSKALAEDATFQQLESDLLKIYDSPSRIPYVSKRGKYYYNFWKDEKNPRGIWRRTTLKEYRKSEPKWEVLLDLDALGKNEKENWVWHGVEILKPNYRRCLISLSRGGADAHVIREFDLKTRNFVEDGFQLLEAKSNMSWIDENTVYVGTDFGPGSMTSSGYPRIAKLWKRGEPLSEATTVYEGQPGDMRIVADFDDTKGFERHFVHRVIAFYKREIYFRDKEGSLRIVDIPLDASGSVFREWLMIQLRSAWNVAGKTYPAGSLLATHFDDFMVGKREFTVVYTPTPNSSLVDFNWTRHHLIVNILEDVKNRLVILTPGKNDWKRESFPGAPQFSTISVWGVDPEESDDYFMDVDDFLTPSTLFLGRIGAIPVKLKEEPAFFDASNFDVSQHFATSKDGTRVPYFQVSTKDLNLDGNNPTLLNGYGGFEISLLPFYSGAMGRGWLSRGGVYVVANIRGGGEYGPGWHQAALKEKRHRAYEDFAAVAEDLVSRKVTNAKHLGILGGSNGGLLMGNMLTLYPQLFGAVVCMVPLLDMQRYSHLLAGAAWTAEYGDPDKPEEWAFIQTFSPYHLVKKGGKYPPVFFTTSTRDDRVHPGHARKMMARMTEMGHDVLYYENIEGGHGGAADNKQRAHMWALALTFLWQKLK